MKFSTNRTNSIKGMYSINKSSMYFLLIFFLFILFAGELPQKASIRIENAYIRKIYCALTEPFADLSSYIKVNQIVPIFRKKFLYLSGLEKHAEWDSFYYNTGTAAPSAELTELESGEIIAAADSSNFMINKIDLPPVDGNYTDEQNTENNYGNETRLNDEKLSHSEISTKSQEAAAIIEEVKEAPPIEKHRYNKHRPFKLLMFGDSQMRSLAGGFSRLVADNKAFEIKEISIHSSGFIRGDYYNWRKKLETVFAECPEYAPYDAAVIILGMNDYQNFYDQDGKILLKETALWEEQYMEKMRNVFDVVAANVSKVYWLGMPTVKNIGYNQDLAYIDKLQNKFYTEYGNENIVKIALKDIAPGKALPYTSTIKMKNGKPLKLMRDDGVHYTISGGQYIMNTILTLIYKNWDIDHN